MSEQFATANGLELCYETFGEPTDPALLLIMGLGSQMINWDTGFCELLAAEGFFTIRYDNRDVGRSTRIDAAAHPATALLAGEGITAPYTLSDMAADAAGLLDALGIEAAHIVGASMGGMIAQTLAIEHPERVLSLCSIMSTTGELSVGQATPAALAALATPIGTTREEVAEGTARIWSVIGSPAYPPDDEYIRERGRQSFDRGLSPDGFLRQVAAVIKSGDRTPALAAVTAPTLVIHGRDDPLVALSGGEATASAIPGARLEIFDGMGHDLPRPLWERFITAIGENARLAA